MVDRRESERDFLKTQVASLTEEIEGKKAQVEKTIKARWVVTEVAKLTQQYFEGYVEKLVTMAIRSVFERDYKFLVDFEIKSNRSECFLRVQEGDWEPYTPEDQQGGGIIDVIGETLQPILWSLMEPRSRNTFFLDEPLKNMGDLIGLGGKVLRMLSHKGKFQLIISTHDVELMKIADKGFGFIYDGKTSKVIEINDIPDFIAFKEQHEELDQINKVLKAYIIYLGKERILRKENRSIDIEEKVNFNLTIDSFQKKFKGRKDIEI